MKCDISSSLLPQPINEANKGTPEIWPIACVVHKSDGMYYAGWLSIKDYMEMLFCEWPVFVFPLFPTCSLVGGGFLSLMIVSNRTTIKTKNNDCCFFCVRICIFGLNMPVKLQTSFSMRHFCTYFRSPPFMFAKICNLSAT